MAFDRIHFDSPDKCWNWGNGDRNKHPWTKHAGKGISAHRLIAHMFLGFDLNSQLHVLHKCDNPRCVNPRHLFTGTNLDNMRDRDAKGRQWCQKKTHCKYGHLFDEKNTYIDSDGNRNCRTCHRIYQRERSVA